LSASESAASPGRLAGEVRRLAAPAILQSCLQTLVFVVDRFMLGRLGETPLAGMQIAGPLEWSLFSILLAFEVGIIARVGHHVGGKRPADARAAAVAGLFLAAAFGLVVVALSPLVLAHLELMAPRASEATVRMAADYLGVMLVASPIVFLTAAGTGILQASGDTKTPLAIAAIANLVHVPLNRVLILGAFGVPALGMRGCGISTAATFGIEVVLLAWALLRRNGRVTLRAPSPLPREAVRAKTREILQVAWPSVLERVLYHTGFIGFVMMIGRLGDSVMAGNQVLISIESICFLSADGFGIAAAALVAQKLGAGERREAERIARIAARDAIVLLTLLGVTAFTFRDAIVGAFVPDAGVQRIATSAMFVLMVAQPFMAASIVLAQALRGAGRTKEALAATSVSALAVRLAATYVFAFVVDGGLRGVWWGSTCDWMVRSVLVFAMWTSVRVRQTAARA
jgi:putative MATE family efflux protein